MSTTSTTPGNHLGKNVSVAGDVGGLRGALPVTTEASLGNAE
jgi:hypothetical protein